MTILSPRQIGPWHMGALPSRFKKNSCHKWKWSGAPGEHSPYPTDPAPYPGYEMTYCFMDILASYQVLDNRLNLGPTAVSTNVEEYIEDLRACYSEGYCLNTHVRIPGVKTTIEVEDWGVKTPYQAIFSKQVKDSESGTEYDLVAEKCILSTKMRAFDALEGENDLLRTIQRYAEVGGQLQCAVPVGYVRSPTSNDQYAVMGMELFFNVPKHKTKTRYTYHAIKIPAKYYVGMDATQTVQQVTCDSDFEGQMKLFLNQGWKLVDICIDTMALSEAFRLSSAIKQVDMVWLFEKDQTCLEDITPMYEGVILEYLHKVKRHNGIEHPCKDWRPVIAGMGVMGWELTAIIQTPVLIQTGFTTFTLKLLLIFQRKLVPSFEELRKLQSPEIDIMQKLTLPTPEPARRDSVFRAQGKSENETGYYHQTLKKFIYSNDGSARTPLLLQTHSTAQRQKQEASYKTDPYKRRASYNNLQISNGLLPQGRFRRTSSLVQPPAYKNTTRVYKFPNT